ncbi:MAG: SUMF1/EgtB/PvdO family nonheme iron enzyme [Culturomica sp.]|nr:SUMF1/EgtB/PvdO family nonheme iron enzyme [Culturomica sp.]
MFKLGIYCTTILKKLCKSGSLSVSAFLILFFCDLSVLANNVRFNTNPSVFLSGDTVMISFSLSWDHAWRDDFNWDAVWVFGKWSKDVTDTWHHLKLSPTGNIMPSGFTYDVGKIDANTAGGIFIMRAKDSHGNVNNQTFTIKALRSNIGNITQEDINENDVFISLSAVEMVYIPYGGYYLGDGATANRLGSNNGSMIAVNSEDALSVYPVTSGNVGSGKSLPATYPKGYKGFYCMKHEVSQDQYVGFLNSLTRAQQKARIGNNLDELKAGEYVFGDKSRPSYRNGICVLSNSAGQPAIFGCNLNPAEPYFGDDDGRCIACNYLTPADMLAYCDWACLRPMSELEYEKACRKPYPQAALGGEFVWNSASGVNGLSGAGSLLNAGRVNEQPSSAAINVNYNNGSFGPVRSAAFGTSNSTQAQAGATFWGLMEMSGNVAELCYSVDANSYFNTSDIYNSHGNGEINTSGVSDVSTSIWSKTATYFIAKGGSFASGNTDKLKISDRTRATIAGTRDSTVGFRAVHTFGGNVTVDAGTISVPATGCANGVILSETKPAGVTWNGVAMDTRISYVWYVQKGSAAWELIPNETSESVTYVQESFSGASLALKFQRKAITALGEAETAVVSTTVPNLTISFSPVSATLSCNNTRVIASVPYTATTPTFTWTTETGTKTGVSYTPAYSDFKSGSSGNILVTCQAELSGCRSSANLTVAVSLPPTTQPKISFNNCGSNFTDNRDGQVYPTVQIGEQCWMSKNMNVGEVINSSSVYTSHQTAGIQKICFNNTASNCNTYGGLYSWAEAVNGENVASGAINTDTDFNKKCVLDLKGNAVTQGICPDGWHVSSDEEFKTLEMYLGMTQAQADDNIGDGWGNRGTNQGRQLKSTSSLWKTTSSSSSTSGTNSSGWSGLPGGYCSGTSFSNFGGAGHWWSSSEGSSSGAWIRRLGAGYATVYRGTDSKSYSMSVRCLLN